MTSDDPRLSAYALGELAEHDRAAVEAALAKQPELGEELEELAGLSALLSETLRGEGLSLGEERHEEIFKAGKRPDGEVIVMENKKALRLQSIFAVAGVAAVVTLGFYLLSQTRVEVPGGLAGTVGEGRDQVGGAAGAGAGAGSGEGGVKVGNMGAEGVSDVAQLVSREEVMVTELTALRLPLRVSRADLSGYERSLTLGRPAVVRAEEWVNAGQYSFEPDVSVAGVGVSAELGACPWDAERNLLLVLLKDMKADGLSPEVVGNLLLESGRVKRARLVASRDVSGEIPRVQRMLADSSVALLYELELLPGEERVASIDLEVMTGGMDSKNCYLPVLGESQTASVNYEAAVTLARFARWQNSREKEGSELASIYDDARALLGQVSESGIRYALDLILLTVDAKK